ncbi:GNAT family N-acetyltransferase [Rhodobacter calidifons]|uniref:GNAT family N-acetyltransferase n=1 Tax=Rhodobacter calidifons TaxID=2715277 RepID=UPI00349E8BC0
MIRPARAEDAPALAALLNHWILHSAVTFNPVPRTEADILAMIAEKAAAGHAFLVAEEAGRVIGQASYGHFRAGGPAWNIQSRWCQTRHAAARAGRS